MGHTTSGRPHEPRGAANPLDRAQVRKAQSTDHECRDLSPVYEALDARRGLRRHGDAHARHRRRQHRPLAHRRRPRHGPQRTAVGRRRLHARARLGRPDRGLAGRPLRPPAPVHHRPRRLHRRLRGVRGLDRHRLPRRRPRRAGHRRRGHVRRLAGPAGQRLPGHEGARRGAGRLRRHHRRLVRRRPARRRRADQRPGLAVDLPDQHPDRASSACGSRAPRSRSRAIPPRRPSTCPARSRSPPASSCSCSRCCAATRWAGAARRSSPSSPAPPSRSSPSSIIEARSTHPMLPLRLFRNPSFTGAQIAAFGISASFFAIFLYATLYLQQVLGLSAIEAGLVYLPGTILNFVVAGASSQVGEKVSHRIMISVGLALVAIGMVLFTLAGTGSSWTVVLPGELDRALRRRPVQPVGHRRRPRLGAAGAERPRRRRQRHVPPGGHRGRHRRPRRADPVGGRDRQRLAAGVRRRPAQRLLRRRGAGGGGRRGVVLPHPQEQRPPRGRGAARSARSPWPRRPSRPAERRTSVLPLYRGKTDARPSEPATDLVRVLAQARRPAAHRRRRRAEAQRRAHGAHAVGLVDGLEARARRRRRRPARRR